MDDYEIGYCKPPRKYQFKPGQSGNPKGRPRKPKDPLTIDDAEILRRLDDEIIEFGGKEMTRREVEIRVIFGLAARKNRKARRLLNRLRKRIPSASAGGVRVLSDDEFERLQTK